MIGTRQVWAAQLRLCPCETGGVEKPAGPGHRDVREACFGGMQATGRGSVLVDGGESVADPHTVPLPSLGLVHGGHHDLCLVLIDHPTDRDDDLLGTVGVDEFYDRFQLGRRGVLLGILLDLAPRGEQAQFVVRRPSAGLQIDCRLGDFQQGFPAAGEAQKALEAQLTDPDSPRLTIGVPDSCQEGYSSAQAFRVRRGAQTIEVGELELRHLLQFVKDKPPGERLQGLGDLRVTMFSDDDFQTPAGVTTSGKEWLIADVPLGTDRLFYGNGKWFEVGAGFIETLEEELTNLFAQPQTVTLPRWTKGPQNSDGQDTHDEDWFNRKAAEQDGYLLFDKDTVRTVKFRGGGLEICDVLGPDNQLICIKKAPATTAPLNHLFAQGVVAVETLRSDSVGTRQVPYASGCAHARPPYAQGLRVSPGGVRNSTERRQGHCGQLPLRFCTGFPAPSCPAAASDER